MVVKTDLDGPISVARILSIDGGGIRGVIPATVLELIEKRTGRAIVDLFDGFVGTSTGGILAMGLTCPAEGGVPRSAETIGELYTRHGPVIFERHGQPARDLATGSEARFWGPNGKPPPGSTPMEILNHLMGQPLAEKIGAGTGYGHGPRGDARYPSEPLERILGDFLGSARMSEALKPVIVVSCDYSTGEPLLFSGGGLASELGDPEMRVVARATSAAPTFFPWLSYRDPQGRTRICVDGGLVANDPVLIGYNLGKQLLGDERGLVLILSIGTGEPVDVPHALDIGQSFMDRNWSTNLQPALRALWDGPATLARSLVETMPDAKCFRIQPGLPATVDSAMDNAAPSNIRALQAVADAFLQERDEAMDFIIGSFAKLAEMA